MGVKNVFFNIFPFLKRSEKITVIDGYESLSVELYYKHLAIQSSINLIANTLSQAEIEVYRKGQQTKDNTYYLFNVEPNRNQNATSFWSEVVEKLVYNNEVLVFMVNNELYIADDFEKKEYAVKENEYYNIIKDNYVFKKKFKEKDVLYFRLHSEDIKYLIDGLYSDYGKLIEKSKSTYKRSNAMRGTLEIPTNYAQTPAAQENLDKLLKQNFKSFFNAEDGAVLPLSGGLKFTDLTNQTYKNGSDSRDIKQLIEDVFDYVAMAFQIPSSLLKGTVADSDKSWDNLMAFNIGYLTEILSDEINRKYFGKDSYLKRNYIKFNTLNIRPQSLKDKAYMVDILTRNGVNTLDDNLELLGREKVGGELGSTRFGTKNYDLIENIKKGGN